MMSTNHFRSHFWPFHMNTNFYFFLEMFEKMAAGGHIGCPKITFDLISIHFTSKRFFFLIFDKMADVGHFGCSKFHFRLHFWPFQIDTRLNFFDKMADVGHFGCPKFTFDRISGHFRSKRNFNFVWNFLTKWLRSAILDVQNSLSMHFWPFQIDRPFWIS